MNPTYLLITSADYQGAVLEIRGAKYHHLAHVRRVRVGAPLRAALPDGRVFVAEVAEITAELLRATITGEEQVLGLSPCRITLYQAVLKGEKMDMVVQKAGELGATTLVPLPAKRSIPQWTPAQALQRTERWQRIADAAAEQCERCIPLQVLAPQNLSEAIQSLQGRGLLLHEREGEPLPAIARQFPDLTEVGLFLGPEGGWDDVEVRLLRDAGVMPVHLGGRVLRAETASIVAITLAQYLWGDLGNPSLEG